MKIKRFIAPDMRQAIRMVRNEQGPDAVILSSRNVDDGIEIISAIDYDQNLIAEMVESAAEKHREQDSADLGEVSVVEEEALRGFPSADEPALEPRETTEWGMPEELLGLERAAHDPSLSQVRQELNAMKSMLQEQFSRLTQDEYARRNPLKAAHVKRLEEMGIGEKLAQEIVRDARDINNPEKMWREILFGIAKRIPIAKEDLLQTHGVIALIGPTGVGKTTTLAKLAARYALHHGPDQVAMITVDNYRIGAHRQLQTYGQILGVPVLQSSVEKMGRVLEGLEDKKMILIDTSGMGYRDRRLRRQLAALAVSESINIYLTLAANAQRDVIDQVIEAFGVAGPMGCVLTKLDETANLGEALTAIIRHRLPLAYLTAGQRVPEDLKPARVSDLVSRMIALRKRNNNSTEEVMPMSGAAPLSTKEVLANAHV